MDIRKIISVTARLTLVVAASGLGLTFFRAEAQDNPPSGCTPNDSAQYSHEWGADGKVRVTLRGSAPLCRSQDFSLVTWLTEKGQEYPQRRWAVSAGAVRDPGVPLTLTAVDAGSCLARQALYASGAPAAKLGSEGDQPPVMDSRSSGDTMCALSPAVTAPVTRAADCPPGVSGAVISVAMAETEHDIRPMVLIDNELRGMLPLDAATPAGIVLAPGLATGDHMVTVQSFGSKDGTRFPPVTLPMSLVSCNTPPPAGGGDPGQPLPPGVPDGSGDGLVPPQPAGEVPPVNGQATGGAPQTTGTAHALAYTGSPVDRLLLIGVIMVSLGGIALSIPTRRPQRKS